MANLTPLTSQSPSKENDSIDDGSAQRRAIKSRDDDDFEDSLNVSISEHISEEIESTSAVEDSIEKSAQHFDQLVADKKRKLFDFDVSDKSDGVDSDGVRKFSKFDVEHLLDESLSGDNIAKHFMADVETSTQRNSSVNERLANVSQQRTKSDELKIAEVNEGAAVVSPSQPTATTAATATNVATHIDEMQKSKDKSNLVELVSLSDSHKSGSDSRNSKNDVILINDQEISIHSLKELQEQRSRSDIEANFAQQTNQNTTSDISDLQNEDNAKEQRSIEDLSGISINESSAKVESEELDAEPSKSSSERVSRSKSESQSQTEKQEESSASDENIKKCKPMEEDLLPELSVIEEVSATDEQSNGQNIVESVADKKSEMQKIIDETISRLPLDKENRPPNLNDDLLSAGSKHLTSSQNSTLTEGTVYNALAKIDSNLVGPNFADELQLNLIHLQNKIKELHNINAGRYSASFFDFSMISSSRRNSLIQEFPQSGRESSSITTNSTEYRPFQDEYSRVSLQHFHMAIEHSSQTMRFCFGTEKKTKEMHCIVHFQ